MDLNGQLSGKQHQTGANGVKTCRSAPFYEKIRLVVGIEGFQKVRSSKEETSQPPDS